MESSLFEQGVGWIEELSPLKKREEILRSGNERQILCRRVSDSPLAPVLKNGGGLKLSVRRARRWALSFEFCKNKFFTALPCLLNKIGAVEMDGKKTSFEKYRACCMLLIFVYYLGSHDFESKQDSYFDH